MEIINRSEIEEVTHKLKVITIKLQQGKEEILNTEDVNLTQVQLGLKIGEIAQFNKEQEEEEENLRQEGKPRNYKIMKKLIS